MSIQTISDKLGKQGYKLAFGITGSGISYQLIKAMTDQGVKYIPVSNESVAAIAAGAATYHNGYKSACISIKGPGFVNLLSGLSACYFERFPVLSFSEDYDTSVPVAKQHKRVDQIAMVRPVAKRIASMAQVDSLDNFLADDKGNEGILHLELAAMQLNEQEAPVVPLSGEASVSEALEKISKAERPVLIIGSLIYRLDRTSSLEQLSLPVFTTAQAKGNFDEQKPNACGVYTGVGESVVPEQEIIDAADLVVTIGVRNYEILGVDGKKNFLNIDIPTSEFADNTLFFTEEQIEQTLSTLAAKTNWCADTIVKYRNALADYVKSYEWMPGQVFSAINELPYDLTMVLDTGTFCTIGEHVFTANSKKRFIGASNGRNMGTSIPIALGVAIDSDPVICNAGDGGIRYHIGDIRTIAEMNLPVCIILHSDELYGSVACSISEDKLNKELVAPKGMEWYKVIGAMDVPSYLVTDEASLKEKLNNWDRKGPLFIEARFDVVVYREITKNVRR